MLAKVYSFAEAKCEDFEVSLLLILAATEGGSTEAIMWLMPLEGLLRRISIHAKKSAEVLRHTNKPQTRMCQELLQELITCAYGVALCNVALRFHWKRPGLASTGHKESTDSWNV
jgi:hypothetical protein